MTPQHQLLAVVKTLKRLAAETVDPKQAEALRSHAESLWLMAADITAKVSTMLTPAQASVLAYIRQHIAEHDQAPTRTEIGEAFGYRSPNSVQEHLRALERKGYLTLTGAARGIRMHKRTSIATQTGGAIHDQH